MIGLFVVLTALMAPVYAVLAMSCAYGSGDAASVLTRAEQARLALFWISLLVADCVTLGYLAARW